MKKTHVKPRIEVVLQQYNEGLMQVVSIPVSTDPSTIQDAKPSDGWGESPNDDTWGEPKEW